jgi:hypothetical protein
MLNNEHTRIVDRGPATTANSREAIEIIIDNSYSLAIATLPEIAEKQQHQRIELKAYRKGGGPEHRELEIGCHRLIRFRRNPSDPNETSFHCGADIQHPYVPHICCCCEALLSLHNTRQSNISIGLTPKAVNQIASKEEDTLIAYREEGEIHPRYLGQYVELERKRWLQVQETQFHTYITGPTRERISSSVKTSFESKHPFSDDES